MKNSVCTKLKEENEDWSQKMLNENLLEWKVHPKEMLLTVWQKKHESSIMLQMQSVWFAQGLIGIR